MSSRRSRQSVSESDTPYKNYLYTNFVPSEDECRRIRDFVILPIQELRETTNEIARLQDLLKELAQKREELREFVQSHLALVSGARRLPHDILGEIFMAALPQNDTAPMDPMKSPLLLLRICNEWRRLALSMPRLWASPCVSDYSSSRSRRNNTGVKMWLTRSGSLPLSISYTSYTATPSSTCLQTLIDCSSRWKHIRFNFHSFRGSQFLEDLSPEDVPLLKTIIIGGGDITERGVDPAFFSFIRSPSIRAMSLRRHSSSLKNLLASEHLAHLSLRAILFTDALDIFRRCPALQTCNLEICGSSEDVLPTSAPIHLEGMHRLSVVDFASAVNTSLFDHLHLPNLQCLEYCAHNKKDPFPVLTSLSTPHILKDLSLSAEISIEALAEVLRRFDMLQTLLLHRPRKCSIETVAGSSMFTLLTPPSSSSSETLCPRLRSLHSLGFDLGSDNELLNLIEARRGAEGVQPLSIVHISFKRKQEVDITQVLTPGGGVVELRYPTDAEFQAIIPAPMRRGGLTLVRRSVYSHIPSFPDSPELLSWQRDPTNDWAPISGEWLAEYAQWGREGIQSSRGTVEPPKRYQRPRYMEESEAEEEQSEGNSDADDRE
ncbi:hypothetical protein MVEN_02192700 [Mycena venus]|uniref:F-box domain-containing protein n=1 Tax=Mycena venus TaxID=2733690 RepID=A0A8H6X6E9_9AGAR|nr:hypothetical protein MVEN_02192700 [Mycena venus]